MLAYFLARLTAPIAFATRARTARHLFAFALAEHESMLELRAAAALSASPERRALYLRHALDEDRHATTFAAHSGELRRALGKPAYGHPRTDCESLYERLGEEGFLAFVHRGEQRGRAQFQAYVKFFAARGDDKLRALFTALIPDEQGHESYTHRLLVEVSGGERQARRALRKMAVREAFRRWRRAGQGIARIVYAVGMLVLYATLLPFAFIVRWARPTQKGWRA
jgi:rubrerythrin